MGSTLFSESNQKYWFAAIIILAAFLRFWGINFGLPHVYHADEPILINQAIAYGAGNWLPIHMKIPQLVGYLLFFCYGVYFVILKIFGFVASAEEFGRLFLRDPTSFYLIARILFGAVLGTLHVVILYKLVLRYFTRAHALWSAFFFAIAFIHVRNSHYIYMDMPLLTLILISYFPIFRILESDNPRTKDYVLFGVLLGAAVAAKYNGFFIVVPLLTAHLYAHRFRFSAFFAPKLWQAALASILGFAILNPLVWLKAKEFFGDLFSMGDFEGYLGPTHHLFYSLKNCFEPPFLVLCGVGLFFLLLSRKPRQVLMLSFPLFYYGLLVFFSQEHDRYILPIIPFVVFFGAEAMVQIRERFKWSPIAVALVAILVSSPILYKSIMINKIFASKDLRTVALEWFEESIPAGSAVAMNTPIFIPRLKPTIEQLQDKFAQAQSEGNRANIKRLQWMIEDAQNIKSSRYNLYFLSEDLNGLFLFSRPRIPFTMEALKENQIRYVIYAKTSAIEQPAFYEQLKKEATLVKRFTPYKDPSIEWPMNQRMMTSASSLMRELRSRTRNGYILEIYRLS